MGLKHNKLPLIVLFPVIVGIALVVSGIVQSRDDLLTAGIIVLFGGSFFVAVITCVITIVCAARSNTYSKAESRGDYTVSARSEARERVAQKTGGMSSETYAAFEKIEDSVRKRRRTERFTKLLGVLFVVAFISFLFGGMGLMIAGNPVAGGIVFACGPAMILISFFAVKIKEHILLSGTKASSKNYSRKVGRVKQCTLNRGKPSQLYRIEVEVDGRTHTTDSEQAYSVGKKVEVTVYRNGKFGSIVGSTEYSLVRAKTENIQKYGTEKVEVVECPETTISAPSAAVPPMQAEEIETEDSAAQCEQYSEERYSHTPPTDKRPTVGYKGINRKR